MLGVLSLFTSDGLATFRNFLKSEYSDENIEFWLTCEDYKKIKSSFRMSSRAKKIYEQFIKAESPKEVNPAERCFTFCLSSIYLDLFILSCHIGNEDTCRALTGV